MATPNPMCLLYVCARHSERYVVRVSACQSMGTPVACACMCALASVCMSARVPKLGVRVHLEVLAC